MLFFKKDITPIKPYNCEIFNIFVFKSTVHNNILPCNLFCRQHEILIHYTMMKSFQNLLLNQRSHNEKIYRTYSNRKGGKKIS
jgi:hypothetical protein